MESAVHYIGIIYMQHTAKNTVFGKVPWIQILDSRFQQLGSSPSLPSSWNEAVFCRLLGRRRALNATITRQELKCSFCGLWSHCPCHHHRHHHHGMNGIQPKQHLGFYFNLVKCMIYYMCKRCRFHVVMNGIQANRASRLLFQIFIARPRIPQRALLVFSRQPPPGGKICPGWIALQCNLN